MDKVPTKTRTSVRSPSPYPSFLTVIIEGKPMIIQGPTDLLPDDLGEFLTKFKAIKDKSL